MRFVVASTLACTLFVWSAPAFAQGLTMSFFPGGSCTPLPDQIAASRLQRSLRLDDAAAWAAPAGVVVPYTARMSGMFRAATAGMHRFRFVADDGIVFTIDGVELYNVLPPRGLNTNDVAVDLTVGDHVFEICHVEDGGPVQFRVLLNAPGAMNFVDIAPTQMVYDPGFQASATTVNFDALTPGRHLTNDLEPTQGLSFVTQLGSTGFYYSRPRVVAAAPATTASPPNVLQNESYDAIEGTQISANVPLTLRFTVPQSHVSIETGTHIILPLSPSAVLRGYNSAGVLVAAHRLDNISPSVIHRLHILRGATDIALVSLDHGNVANDERVDGLRFEAFAAVAPPPDTEPPVVEFVEPANSEVRGSGPLRVIVRIRENSGDVVRVQASAGATPVNLEPDGTPDFRCVPPICSRYLGGLALGNGPQSIVVEAEDAAGNVGTASFDLTYTGVTEVVIVDAAGGLVNGAELFINGAARAYTADADGVIRLLPPLAAGTQLAARRRLFESQSPRGNHAQGSTQDWNFRTYLTSVVIGDAGQAQVNIVTNTTERQQLVIRRDNVLFGVHLTGSLEWDATGAEINDVVAKMQTASDFLYNATDGQFVIEQFDVTDRASDWNNVDLRVYVRDLRAHVTNHSGGFLGNNLVHTEMNVSRSRDDGPVYAHEFGHFGFDVRDEYQDDDPQKACTAKAPVKNGGQFEAMDPQASCMMWSQWRAPKLCSGHASNPHVTGLKQGDTSCWDKIVQRYGNPAFTLKTPTTRGVIPASVTPPVAAWRTLRTSVDNRAVASGRCRVFTQRFLQPDAKPFSFARVWLSLSGGGNLFLGTTSNNGEIAIVGAHRGDVVQLDAAAWVTEPGGSLFLGVNPLWRPGGRIFYEATLPIDASNCLPI